MIFLKHCAIFTAFVGAAVATVYDGSQPACVQVSVDKVNQKSGVHLLCDQEGAAPTRGTGAELYSCKPYFEQKTFVADVVVVKPDPIKGTQFDSVVLTNYDADDATHKIYAFTSASTITNKKTYYFELDGRKSCAIYGFSATQIGGFDPVGVYVYNTNVVYPPKA